jgi:hypothetical protein
MSNSNPNKTTRLVRVTKVIEAIKKYFFTMATIALGGADYTPTALVDRLQKVLDAIKQSSKSKAAWLADVQLERDQIAANAPLFRYIRSFVIAKFGDTQNASSTLEDFGYTPRKPRSKNVQAKAVAAGKGRATRAARGTKGKKQTGMIHETPPEAPANAGPTAEAPAPAASTAPGQVKPA